MTQVAILWHMHQPFYEDLVTREHILPWVRLHALKDYYGMVAMLEEFPGVRVTFNLVPSLLVQLEAFASGQARDRFLDLSLKPAADLTGPEAGFILEHFFHAQRARMIDAHPRYRDLLERRGQPRPPIDGPASVSGFSTDDLRDLQVWHKLAWIDPDWQLHDPRVRRLIARNRDFTEEDKALLREVELELLNRVIPAYRAAAERGQVELSTSPFYHPILPLLCDTDVYLRTHPESRMPPARFRHPEDAAEQIGRAVACHERLFGLKPVGLWPSEGSVSDAMVPLASAAGFAWMATDELILARTLGLSFGRDADGHVDQPERLYLPYQVTAGTARLSCVFRDRVLSDRIGFVYSGWGAEAAADDFVARLVEAGRRYAARNGGEEALIPIILDGENAWEHFEGGGRPFLRALYGRLAAHPELRTVTMSEGCRAPRRELQGIFPGSWIDANFYIWIGHADDQRAWGQLTDARQAIDSAPDLEPAVRARAYEEALIAEGSDWFWWYGDDHSSDHDEEFDDLFRRHIKNVYTLLRQPIPDELFVTNISTGAAATPQVDPAGLLRPTLDGEETSYFEWLGAGAVETRRPAGAMHEADARPAIVSLVQFGFDREHLFARLDGARPLREWLAEGYQFSLKFLEPAGACVRVRETGAALSWEDPSPGGSQPSSAGGQAAVGLPPGAGPDAPAVAAGTVLEVAVRLADLGLAAGARVAFFVAAFDAAGHEVERHPRDRAIEAAVPDAWFAARNWTV